MNILENCFIDWININKGFNNLFKVSAIDIELNFNLMLTFSVIWSFGVNFVEKNSIPNLSKLTQMIK